MSTLPDLQANDASTPAATTVDPGIIAQPAAQAPVQAVMPMAQAPAADPAATQSIQPDPVQQASVQMPVGLPPLGDTTTGGPQPVASVQDAVPVAQTPAGLPPLDSVAPTAADAPAIGGIVDVAGDPTIVSGPSVKGAANLIEAVQKKGLVDAQKIKDIEIAVTTQGKSLEEALVEIGGLNEDDVYKIKAEMFGIEFVDLTVLEFDPAVIQRIPVDLARKYLAIAYDQDVSGLKVAMTDPLDIQKTQFIGASVGSTIQPVFTAPSMVSFVIDNKYEAQVGSEVEEALEDVSEDGVIGGVIGEVTDLDTGSLANAPVSKIVNMILEYSIRYKASDIHIEPREGKIGVRFRIFGVLSEKLTLPKKLLPSIVSRIKILASLKIDEHRVPQDGRFQVKLGKHSIDLRVSIVPAVYGEKIVMRLLEKGGGAMDLAKTGMRGYAFKIFNTALTNTQGIVLVTGPTGSGKTQTLASSLKVLNTPEVNIMTLEDPVEIRVDGVNQVQVNAEVGLSFAKGLRSFLRQDPDIIMVGEIRDAETANLATQAALTGHLVLATLHTNSSSGAIPRLIDMGIEPFLLASTMNVVLAQRLVRKICDHCKEAYYADPAIGAEIHKVLDGIQYDMFKLPNNDAGDPNNPQDDKIALYRGKGCAKCNDTGYAGRIGIFEALEINEKVSKLILQKESAAAINKIAVSNGMITMAQDGFMKALEGMTTVEEVLRVQKH